jgi:hypothetical protein
MAVVGHYSFMVQGCVADMTWVLIVEDFSFRRAPSVVASCRDVVGCPAKGVWTLSTLCTLR